MKSLWASQVESLAWEVRRCVVSRIPDQNNSKSVRCFESIWIQFVIKNDTDLMTSSLLFFAYAA